ncbi:hypothetical protein Naga_102139g1 [Nannochloropsis gaditana]|uniref:Uncharacterized protein n=1 Tax=Nannochloropsis gaditana TaxID=72520 RepID=W7TIZ1_9STRA|nr:hypothetical protein Naga_102139g1 [Nannochloropsis gaditana]
MLHREEEAYDEDALAWWGKLKGVFGETQEIGSTRCFLNKLKYNIFKKCLQRRRKRGDPRVKTRKDRGREGKREGGRKSIVCGLKSAHNLSGNKM